MTQNQTYTTNNLAGIVLVCAAMLVFVCMDALSKLLAEDFHPFQVAFGRYIFTIVFLLPAFFRGGARPALNSKKRPLLFFRGICMLGSALFFIAGLAQLPLAEATAISFLSPILVTALSVPLLKEQVGSRRWMAIIIGFIGILVIVRPGTAVFGLAALLPIGSAVCWALGLVLTRMLHGTESPLTIVLYTALTGLLISAVLGIPVWKAPDLKGWLLTAAMGLCSALGQYLLASGYTKAEASMLAPFSYSQMVWATVLGFLVFSSLPDTATLMGTVIVMASGLYILYRERKLARS